MPPPRLGPERRSGCDYIGLFWLVLVLLLGLLFLQQARSHVRLHSAIQDGAGSDGRGAEVRTAQLSLPRRAAEGQAAPGGGYRASAGRVEVQSLLRPSSVRPDDRCHVEEHNEYHGNVVVWGSSNKKASAGECCQHCHDSPPCNVWVWCGEAGGCSGSDASTFQNCWLKETQLVDLFENVVGRAHDGIKWTAGAVYTDTQYAAAVAELDARAQAEAARRQKLRDDEDLPLVYLDVAIDGKLQGRIEAALFMKDSPLAAENMRQFCTGEHGPGYHLKGSYFYRILDRFIDQTGVDTMSIYGHPFKDDPGGLKLQHDRPYLLSIANSGHDTNTAHFSITCAPAHHLDGSYVIFGECVSGFDVIEAVNALSRGQRDNALLQSKRAQIVDAGQLRRGAYLAPPTEP